MPKAILVCVCLLLGSAWSAETAAEPTTRTLLQVVWDIGAVNKEQAQIERELGEDPLALIELPETSGNESQRRVGIIYSQRKKGNPHGVPRAFPFLRWE